METGLDRTRSLTLLSRIAFALAAVHAAGVIHRDLKPDNVILRGNDAPVLIDFGVALLAGERRRRAPARRPTWRRSRRAANASMRAPISTRSASWRMRC